jgi:hypothetical protein
MTEEHGQDVRVLPGVAPESVAAFVAALAGAEDALAAITARLEAARVHDTAFGRLFDAVKVRDAYHDRLPATERNVAEARAVIGHLRAEFSAPTRRPLEGE